MIALEHAGDVTRVVLSTRWSRAFGYSVSAFLTRGILIDTGFPDVRAEVAALLDRVRPAGVVLTHHHEDHAGNMPLIARHALPVATSAGTLALLAHGERAGSYRRIVWGAMPPFTEPLAPFAPPGLRLVHLPGHSADHHAVWDDERGALFAGDLFLGVRVRVARPGEDPRVLARSLRQAVALGPRIVWDSHRGLIPHPLSALAAKADWLDETIAAIEARIARGWNDRAITRDVLGPEDRVGYVSFGDLSRRNFVRAVRTPPAAAPRLPGVTSVPAA
ncbi:MAG: MBL fold metallo-hydrolase [Gemmatimonadaceae bacterium]